MPQFSDCVVIMIINGMQTVTSILFRAIHCYLTITAVRAFLLSAQYQASQFLIT